MPPRKAKNLPKLFCPECGSPNSEVASFCTNCGKDLRKLDKKISDIDLLTNHFSEFDIKIDSKINDYKNGSHYLAIKEKTGEKVVIKFLNENAAKNKDHKNLFKNWAVVGSIFNHPNILNVEINGEINERDYMVSAYAESGPLDLILSSYGSSGLPIPLALTIMIKVLKGLEEIHNRGYAIRDLKTGNILIHKSGDPMISGFYLARPFGKMGADSEAENSLMGSVAYMSPERCRLTRSVDKRTDIYSAGIIFYELITGELPFQGETHKVLFQQTSRPLPQVTYRLIAKGLNSIDKKEEKVYQYVNEILRILEKACAKPKSGRYPTASEFSADLEKFLNFISIPLEPKKTRDDQWKVLKGYKADQSGGAGEDRLGITGSVEAFARLVSSKSVHPPLSIGLFGNWGAGKSFFINK
ncbi:MAG: protein kinase, partial [Leptospiraceae bacterium]|nr:protein kinase [Leptospiraceae bacterium]